MFYEISPNISVARYPVSSLFTWSLFLADDKGESFYKGNCTKNIEKEKEKNWPITVLFPTVVIVFWSYWSSCTRFSFIIPEFWGNFRVRSYPTYTSVKSTEHGAFSSETSTPQLISSFSPKGDVKFIVSCYITIKNPEIFKNFREFSRVFREF